MAKKSVSQPAMEEEVWEEGGTVETVDEEVESDMPLKSAPRGGSGKPSRQRIEEYFERKRLAEALQEDLDDDIFRRP